MTRFLAFPGRKIPLSPHWLTVLVAMAVSAFAADGFTDPAPPVVNSDFPSTAPEAAPDDALTFHKAPKPLSEGAVTQDWPWFLGPDFAPISKETSLLHEWPVSGPTLVWERRTGKSYTAPSIAGDRLVFFHRLGDEEVVQCLNRETGQLYWEFAYPVVYKDNFGFGNGPKCSPVIVGDHVFTLGIKGMLHCLHLPTGAVRWKRDVMAEFGLATGFFGIGATPLAVGDRLIINLGSPGGPCIAAFDQKTGKMLWGAGNQWGMSYASITPGTVHGKPRVFVFAGGESEPAHGGLISVNPEDGEIDFRFPWRAEQFYSVNASSPVVMGNSVFISEAYGTGSARLSISEAGTATPMWKNSGVGFQFDTPALVDGCLYGFHGRYVPESDLVCVDGATGETLWRKAFLWKEDSPYATRARRKPAGPTPQIDIGFFRGALLHADGAFLCLGEDGHLAWLELSREGAKITKRVRLFNARETWTRPVVSHGLLYICQNETDYLNGTGPRVLCYDLRR